MNNIILEACIESFTEAVNAIELGAHQLEVCANLQEDGLTPSLELVQAIQEVTDIPLKIMIRPRPGHFELQHGELNTMIHSIDEFKSIGISEFVLGNTKNGIVDIEALHQINRSHNNINITFHRAIDHCPSPIYEVARLRDEGICQCILSSGGESTAWQGRFVLADMIGAAGKEIKVIPAGKINQSNIEQLHHFLGASIYHGRQIV